jgi:hypothetical protein
LKIVKYLTAISALILALWGTAMGKQMNATFKNFTGKPIAQASGVAQLAPDRFIIIDDRKNMFYQAILHSKGQLTVTALKPDNSMSFSLQDMEGVTIRPTDPWIYVITSYSDSKKKRRRRLARFQVQKDGNIGKMEKVKNAENLKNQIQISLHKRFKHLPKKYAFNIEALSWTKDGQELLIGLRSPIIMGQAVILRSKGINQAFSSGELTFPTRDISTLDLKSGGIRAMAYFPDLNGYLLISGKGDEAINDYDGKAKRGRFFLWFWDGTHSAREILHFPKTANTPKDEIQPEGLCAVTFRDGTKSVLIGSDDGDLGDKATGKYWLLSPEDYDILKSRCWPNN